MASHKKINSGINIEEIKKHLNKPIKLSTADGKTYEGILNHIDELENNIHITIPININNKKVGDINEERAYGPYGGANYGTPGAGYGGTAGYGTPAVKGGYGAGVPGATGYGAGVPGTAGAGYPGISGYGAGAGTAGYGAPGAGYGAGAGVPGAGYGSGTAKPGYGYGSPYGHGGGAGGYGSPYGHGGGAGGYGSPYMGKLTLPMATLTGLEASGVY